jgi:putative membrane protein
VGWFASGWLQAKLAFVLLLSAVHGFFARWVKAFAADANRHSQRFFRIINEVPAVIMIVIVILVVLKPF